MKLRTLLKAPVLVSAGYGVHSRQIFQALINDPLFDVHVEPLNWGSCSHLIEEFPLKDKIKEAIYKRGMAAQTGQEEWDLFIHVTIPHEFERKAKFNIGVTAGIETDRASPQWIQKCNEMETIIVPSEHSKKTLLVTYELQDQNGNKRELKLEKPLFVCSEGFDSNIFKTLTKEEFEAQTAIAELDFAPDFNFLHVGQWGNGGYGEDRKNIAFLVRYFIEAFYGRKDVGLVLKVNMAKNSEIDNDFIASRLKQIKSNFDAAKVPPIYLLHGTFTNEEMSALYNHKKVKAFISLTHGEGFGLPLLEATACGLPVITTNWSGHLDFLKQGLFVPLQYDLKEIPAAAVWEPLLMKGSRWAEVNEEDTKRRMKKLVDSYRKPKEWAAELQKFVYNNFTLDKICDDFVNTVKSCVLGNQNQALDPVEYLKTLVDTPNDFNVIYTMPMSTGDVFISTAVIDGLMKELPEGSKIYFATQPKYFDVLKNNPHVYKTIPWNESMLMIDNLEKVFDLALTPNVATQYVFSNWVRGGRGRLLTQEFANHCQTELGDYYIGREEVKGLPETFMTVHTTSGKGQWEARNYVDWQEIVNNLKNLYPELKVVQLGAVDEPALKNVDLDLRGKTNYQQLAFVVEKALLHLSPDTFTMHLAAALKTPLVALFGCSYATSTGPWVPDLQNAKYILLQSERQSGCKDKACYKNRCAVNPAGNGPINEIDPRSVFESCVRLLEQGK